MPDERAMREIEADVHAAVEALRAGQAFLSAYRDASASDEEGLLMAVDPKAMVALWAKVDDAAEAFHAALLNCNPEERSGPSRHEEDEPVLGLCIHGVDLDREFCPAGCRV